MKPRKSLQNTIKTLLLAGISVFFLAGCSATKTPTNQGADGIVTFKFIQLNDVYEIAPLSGGKIGGMERVAYVRDSIKAQNPNTFMFLAGDFLNPSLLGTVKYQGERIRGKQMIEVMNAMGFDLVTFGNHEFDIGKEPLQQRLNESTFQWMSCNVKEVTENGNRPYRIQRDIGDVAIPASLVQRVAETDGDQITIGFVGSTIPSNPQDFVHYDDIYTSVEKVNNELKQNGVDIVFGLTHLEIEQDSELARRIPDIPFIMGGHEHHNMRVEVGNSVITKADANAKTIYIHTLTYNMNTKYLKIDSHLMPIDETVPSDPEVKAIVDRWNEVLLTEIQSVVSDPNEVIYKTKIPLDGTDSASRGVQTNLGAIITHAMAIAFDTPAEAALVNGGSIRIDDMLAGDVTSLDIFRVLPFGGHVVKVDIKGDLLIKVLDYGKSQGGNGAYLQRYNFMQDGKGSWLIGQKRIEDGGTYNVALSDFLLKGFDIPFLTPENPGVLNVYEPTVNEPASDIRKAVIDYIKTLTE